MTRRTDKQKRLDAANRHASYMCGWVDGAKVSALRQEFIEHSDQTLNTAYQRGYRAGRAARSIASGDASQIYGHTPEILRLQDGDM